MADRMTVLQRSKCMSHIRSRNTGPERIVRKELYSRGFRYRLNCSSLPGTPDLVLHKYRTAVFVNGCFWHGHENCPKYVRPSSNAAFWNAKVEANRKRDAKVIAHLEALGWFVLTIWECELSPDRLYETMARVETEIRANRFRFISRKEEARKRKAELSSRDHDDKLKEAEKSREALSGKKIPREVRLLSKHSD